MAAKLIVEDPTNIRLEMARSDSTNITSSEIAVIEDYDRLDNKPSIEGVTLIGNKTLEELGLTVDTELDEESNNPIANSAVADILSRISEVIVDGVSYPVHRIFTQTVQGVECLVFQLNDGSMDGLWIRLPTANGLEPLFAEIERVLGSINNQLQDMQISKQDVLTFDSTPTENSENPVTSGGVYTALEGKQDAPLEGQAYDSTLDEYVTPWDVLSAIQQGRHIDVRYFVNETLYHFSAWSSLVSDPDSLLVAVGLCGSKALIGAVPSGWTLQDLPIPTQTSDLVNDGADGTSTYAETDELEAVAAAIPSDYIHDGNYSTVQYRKGGLVIGAQNASESGGVNATAGRIYVTGVSNPLFGLKSSDNGAIQFFLQVTKEHLFVGPTSSIALDFEGATGKVTMPNDVTVKGKIIKNGGTSDQFLKADGSVDSTTYLPSTTKYGAGILVSVDSTDYKITTTLKDQDGNTLGTPQVIDLPLESVVVSGSYDSTNKKIVLTLQNGSTIDVPVGNLIAGLQSEITAQNPLSADYVDDSNSSHKFITAGELSKLAGIEAGAEVNVQSDWNETDSTAADYIKNKPTKTSDFQNDGSDGNAAYLETDETAYRAARIPYGECDSTSTSTAFTATVPGITELKDGVTMLLYNGVVTSASGFTLNINGLGAKPCYSNMTLGNPVTPTNPTRDTTIFNINYAFLFVYSETRVSGGCWIGYRGYDANTNTIGYQLRTNNSTMPTTDKFYRYRLLFTSADGTKWVPANTSTSTNATASRTPNTRAIDPFGEIVWYGTTAVIEANANVTAAQLWQEYYGSYTAIGYSFNNTGAAQTMTANKPIYIKCTPQADGSAIIDPTTPYVQDLPTTDDGKIYIYLGRAYNATNFELLMNHPVYYHDGTGIRLWTGVRQMPAPPSADGTYTLQCTVSNGVATYNWI